GATGTPTPAVAVDPKEFPPSGPWAARYRPTFIYQYDAGNVQDVVPDAIEEFFMDWLMRKVMVKPPEYTQWPPALRLFYRFLSEKGYLDDPEPIIAGLQSIEPAFIAMVRQRSCASQVVPLDPHRMTNNSESAPDNGSCVLLILT